MTSVLQPVETFVIEAQVITDTVGFLKQVGLKGYEGFVLWLGRLDSATRCRVTRVIVPEQRAIRTTHGLLVTVDGDALFRVNKLAYANNQLLCAQVHTHPTSAYHSSTDDDFPLVTLQGALSIVIPNFAAHAPADIETWAWYRLVNYGEWMPIVDSPEMIIE